jgi:dolichol-phosphate mannosyltransferase
MDADFSHRPEDLPKLLDAPESVDVVIGSRYIPGGKILGWDIKRQINSRGAIFVARLLLGIKPKDATAGFKRYSRKFLKFITNHKLIASGYAFQVEMVLSAQQNGYHITEVPITFVDRTVGESKISGELMRSAKIVWRLFIQRQGIRQFVKFALVGLINTVIDWIIFFILKQPLSVHGQLGKQFAKAGSFIVSATSSYILNRRWTFRSDDKRVALQMIKFFIVASIGLVINNTIFYFMTAPRFLGLHDIWGLAFGTGLVMIWNFVFNKYWTFKS